MYESGNIWRKPEQAGILHTNRNDKGIRLVHELESYLAFARPQRDAQAYLGSLGDTLRLSYHGTYSCAY